jgi:hypothetical protein
MEVLGWVFIVIVALLLVMALVVVVAAVPEIKRYTKIRSM